MGEQFPLPPSWCYLHLPRSLDVPEAFYRWLAESEFSKIGKSEEKEMKIDGEATKSSVVLLEGENRRKFSDFLRNTIVEESNEMLNKLGNSPSKVEYQEASDKLKFLQNLRKFVEDEKHKYLKRT